MSKSVKAKLDELLARESHQLREQKIHKISAPMGIQLYGTEKVTTSKRSQFQFRLTTARQPATIWSDADWQRAIEQLECEIHQATPAKRKLFDKLFQHPEREQLHEVGTKATGPRSIFTKKLAQMTISAEEEAYRIVNMTADRHVQFQVSRSDAELEATTCSIADTDPVVNQLERKIHSIPSKAQMWLPKGFSIRLVEFEDWWQAIGILELRKTIEQRVINFGYPMMHLVSHISESIQRMGSGDNFTTQYFRPATYPQSERGILIYQQSQLH